MPVASQTRLGAGSKLLRCVPLPAIFALLIAGSAQAAVVESLTTSSSYTYDFAPGLFGANSGMGDTGVFHVAGTNPTQATAIDIDYGTITATDSSFFFLNNIQCKGYCSVGVTTWVVDTITNMGPDAIDLRFDSSITAGHLGLVALPNHDSSGAFDFDVTQSKGGIDQQLYSANGSITAGGASITTSDGSVFDGLTAYQDDRQIGLDWDETALELALGWLAPGQSTTVTYRSVSYLNSYGICTALTGCDGVQVAFGDPRNNGGIVHGLAPHSGGGELFAQPIGYVLDREFDKATVRANIVILSAPEPGSWAMMLAGFGMIGGAVRKHRRTAPIAV